MNTIKIGTLKKRAEFLFVAQGRRASGRFLSLQMRAAQKQPTDEISTKSEIRYGLTASKKVGNAVKRNRARRRLRVAIQQTLLKYGAKGYDYVAIARPQTCEADFQALVSDVINLIQKLSPKVKQENE